MRTRAWVALCCQRRRETCCKPHRKWLKTRALDPPFHCPWLGLITSLRHSEVCEVRWADVNMTRRVLVVGETKTEAGGGRPVPLTQPAWVALDVWASRFPNSKATEFIFPACDSSRMDPSKPNSKWKTAWRKAREVAGLPGLRYHDLRHIASQKLLFSASCEPNGQPVARSHEEKSFQARSSVWLERYLDTVEVNGSSPFGPTIMPTSKPLMGPHGANAWNPLVRHN
jgi:Phage integrase family